MTFWKTKAGAFWASHQNEDLSYIRVACKRVTAPLRWEELTEAVGHQDLMGFFLWRLSRHITPLERDVELAGGTKYLSTVALEQLQVDPEWAGK